MNRIQLNGSTEKYPKANDTVANIPGKSSLQCQRLRACTVLEEDPHQAASLLLYLWLWGADALF